MKYVAVDFETTGLDPKKDQVLMGSFVVEDSSNPLPLDQLPHLTFFVKHDRYEGSAFALEMNAWILYELSRELKDRKYPSIPIFNHNGWAYEAAMFLSNQLPNQYKEGKIVAAGAQVGSFDMQFMPEALRAVFHYRKISPSSMYLDWEKEAPESTGKLLQGFGITEQPRQHSAYACSLSTIELLRQSYQNKEEE